MTRRRVSHRPSAREPARKPGRKSARPQAHAVLRGVVRAPEPRLAREAQPHLRRRAPLAGRRCARAGMRGGVAARHLEDAAVERQLHPREACARTVLSTTAQRRAGARGGRAAAAAAADGRAARAAA